MRTNARIINSQKIVNVEKKTVVVRLTYEIELNRLRNIGLLMTLDSFVDTVNKFLDNPYTSYDPNTNKITFEVVGKANCMDEDEFNETTGYRIADTRAQIKAMDTMIDFYAMLQSSLYTDLLEDIDTKLDNSYDAWAACTYHVEQLVSGEIK